MRKALIVFAAAAALLFGSFAGMAQGPRGGCGRRQAQNCPRMANCPGPANCPRAANCPRVANCPRNADCPNPDCPYQKQQKAEQAPTQKK